MKGYKWIDFFLFSNFFISFCAAAMTAEVYFLVHADINWIYVAFVFSSTLALYNFPVFIREDFSNERSERHRWMHSKRKLLIALFLFASSFSGGLIFFFPMQFIFWFIPVALLAIAYFFPQTQLRGIAVLKTLVVAFVWTCTTAVFPILLNSEFDLSQCLNELSRAVLLQNFLFIFPLCLIFNVRDIETDRQAGVKTLPVLYGVKFTVAVCLISLLLFSVLIALSPSLREERAGLLISAVAASLLILFASEKRSDRYYSLWVDGMILLQASLLAFNY